MIHQIAPSLFASLNKADTDTLQQLRTTLSQSFELWQPTTVQFTDHSMAHNDAVLRVVEMYLSNQDMKLARIEIFALIAAIYLGCGTGCGTFLDILISRII